MGFLEQLRLQESVRNGEVAGSIEADAGVIDMRELTERNLIGAVGRGLGSAPVAVIGDQSLGKLVG
jgi:hypothetical protein